MNRELLEELKQKIVALKDEIIIDNDFKIFTYLNPMQNNKLSEFERDDLLELFNLMNNYYLELRTSLEMKKYITFGLEIEFDYGMVDIIEKKLEKLFPNDLWFLKDDCSLECGAEINTPILRDSESTWRNLEIVCTMLNSYAAIGKESGGHIHVGTQILGRNKENWLNFLKLWAAYENIIFRFAYGEYLSARPHLNKYAQPIAKKIMNYYNKIDDNYELDRIIQIFNIKKSQSVNLSNVKIGSCDNIEYKNTLEFRCPNGTLDSVIWQNNVNFFINFLEYSKSNDFDSGIIEKRYVKSKSIYSNIESYDKIDLEQALELADLIFKNNLDKIYFLKQYLKSFQESEKRTGYTKARELTRGYKRTLW